MTVLGIVKKKKNYWFKRALGIGIFWRVVYLRLL